MIKNKPKLRSINVHFWDDTYVICLNQKEKFLFLYLLTNTLCSIIGVYEITQHRICFDTGLDPQDVSDILKKFEQDDKIIFSDGYIILVNFIKNQTFNPNMVTCAQNYYESLPDAVKNLVNSLKVFGTITQPLPNHSEPLPNPSQTLTQPLPNPSLTLTQPLPNPSEPLPNPSKPFPNPSEPLILSDKEKTTLSNPYPTLRKVEVEVEVEKEVEFNKKLKLNGKPTLSEVKKLFEKEGFDEYEAVKFYEHNKAKNWMNDGKPVDWLFCSQAWIKQIKKSSANFKNKKY